MPDAVTMLPKVEWPYVQILLRLALSLALGLLIGLERERRGKEAGLRTFGFICLLGALGGSLGDAYGLLILALVGVLAVLLNLHTLRANEGMELTTSAAMLVTCRSRTSMASWIFAGAVSRTRQSCLQHNREYF